MQNFYGTLSSKKPGPTAITTSPTDCELTSDPTAALNTTYTMDVTGAKAMTTPAGSKASNSYNMTPMDPLIEVDNYGIDNLESGDSTDDEDNPKKVRHVHRHPRLNNITTRWFLFCLPSLINQHFILSNYLYPLQDIPLWADSKHLEETMSHQLEAIDRKELSIHKIFPPEELLKSCDLNKIFKFKRKRFLKRTSSALWNSPSY